MVKGTAWSWCWFLCYLQASQEWWHEKQPWTFSHSCGIQTPISVVHNFIRFLLPFFSFARMVTRAKKTNFSLCYLGISDMAGWIAERFFSSNFYYILSLLKFGGIFKFVRLSQSAYLKQTYYKTKQNKQDHLICAPIRWVRSKLDFTWKN